MSEIMRPMSIDHLMHWIMSEYEQKRASLALRRL